jgi:hypothetical protein
MFRVAGHPPAVQIPLALVGERVGDFALIEKDCRRGEIIVEVTSVSGLDHNLGSNQVLKPFTFVDLPPVAT